MTASELRIRKKEFEARIAGLLSGEMDVFEYETGFSISSITVYIHPVGTVGEQPKFIVADVLAEIEI
jgi:hypothetical protein